MITPRQIAPRVIWETWWSGWQDLQEQCFPLFKADQQRKEGFLRGISNRIGITVLGAVMFLVYWLAHTVKSSLSTLTLLKSFILNKYPTGVLELDDDAFPAQIRQAIGNEKFREGLPVGCLYFPHAHLICFWWWNEFKIFNNFKDFEDFVKTI